MPRDVWGETRIRLLRPAEWYKLLERFPRDFDRMPSVLGPSARTAGDANVIGKRTDEWGSVWTKLRDGVSGEVTGPVLADWGKFESYSPPWEMVEHSCVDAVNACCGSAAGFRLGEVGPGPFERIQNLRGPERLFLDLGEQPPELDRLMGMVHDFYLRHFSLWCETDVDGITIGDDWGAQTSLLISPGMWRRKFKPLYAEYCDIARRAGKRIFFHSDGMVREIIPDLIAIGVSALNCQVCQMNTEELGESFRGRIAFWGEIDQQWALPFGTPDDVRKVVRRVRAALGSDRGGLIAQLHWGIGDPYDNIAAAFEEFDA